KTNNNFHVSLEAIKAGTQNFSDYTCVGEGRFWKLYEGEITDANGCTAIFAKRWDSKAHQSPLAVRYYKEEGNLDNMIFDGIKEQITPPSLIAFQTIAIQCLQFGWNDRPTMTQLITQLKKALEFQEDYEIWEPKLPTDYKEIIQRSKTPDIYSDKTKKDLYDMFSKGILLQDDKVLFSLGTNGERNEMISAKRFSYNNHLLPKWRSLPESSSRKSQAKRMYVNLKYKMGNERFYSKAFPAAIVGAIQSILKAFNFKQLTMQVKQGEIEKSNEVQQVTKSKSDTDKFLPMKMLSAEEIVHNSSDVAIQYRFDMAVFEMAVELLRKQVFPIKCKISSKMLSAHTENVCYLVFKLSEKCCGLHGPVIVRDQFHWRSKEKGILYFRSPNPCNNHETNWIPEKREDGWME
ncbi:hypothetical protein M8C21_027234, partial [Ambrosia artemisiifolia]